MEVEEEIVARLRALSVAGGRVYALTLPQTPALPAVTYSVVSKTRSQSRSGTADLASMRLQLSAVDKSYAAAKGAAVTLRAALQDYAGGSVNRVLVSGDRDFVEPDTGRVRVVMDAMVEYREG